MLAATNRPEVLDQALLRPGRFDRRITIDRPNLAGRIATLQVHTRNIKLAEDVNLKKVALATAGCVGADLANLVNEAALRAVRKGRKLVTQEDLLAAFELVIAGTEKKGSVLTEFEKEAGGLPRGGPRHGGLQAEEHRAGAEDHHRPPHPGLSGLHPADARGGQDRTAHPATS